MFGACDVLSWREVLKLLKQKAGKRETRSHSDSNLSEFLEWQDPFQKAHEVRLNEVVGYLAERS